MPMRVPPPADFSALWGGESGWTRKGDCSGCGYCCRYIGPQRHLFQAEAGETLDLRYWLLRGARPESTGRRVHLLTHVEAPCAAWQPTVLPLQPGAPVGACTIYAERPQVCRDFPWEPGQVEGTPCSYWFERALPSEEVVRRGGDGSPYPTPPSFPQVER